MSRRLEKNNLAVWKKKIKTKYCINLPKKQRKAFIRFALLFLAKLCNNLSYILQSTLDITYL